MRLDVYLAENGLCKSRAAAQSLISEGGVSVNGKIAAKPALSVNEADEIIIVGEQPRYVGRGGLKLERAVEVFAIDLRGKTCVDVGASTGGFTDCMLQNGAEKVFAVDVGSAQLDEKLRGDPRVISLENTDIRDYSPETLADFVGADVSFISLKLILPHVFRLLKSGGQAVVLIKPQFEVGALPGGKKALSKRGVVNDEKLRMKVVGEIIQSARECGFSVIGTETSPIKGGEGNTEYLLALRKDNQ